MGGRKCVIVAASYYSYLTLLEFDMIGQQISLAKSRSTRPLEC